MKNLGIKFIVGTLFLGSFNSVFAQNTIQLSNLTEPIVTSNLDTVLFGEENHQFILSWPLQSVDKITFQTQLVSLSATDNPTSGNQLQSVSLTSSVNPSVYKTVTATKNGNEFSLFVPYLTSFSNLKISFNATGTVYCDESMQKSGISQVDFSQPKTYKVVDEAGNVATYIIRVYNSGLPVVYVSSNDNSGFSTNWSVANRLLINQADGETDFDNSEVELKYKGSKYSTSDKRSYSVKLDKKESLLSMSKGKRWSIYSNADDASLLRTRLAYLIASQMDVSFYVPSAIPVELVENDVHKGSYLLTEEPRISEDRVQGSILCEEISYSDKDDNSFTTTMYGKTFSVVDDNGMTIESTKNILNQFENSLSTGSGLDLVDINSFVDWYLLNELFKNEDAASEGMFSINSEEKLVMGPLSSQEDAMGNGDASVEGFVLNEHPWFAQLIDNPTFVSLLWSRFLELKQIVEAQSTSNLVSELALSFTANQALYGGTSTLSTELTTIQSWLIKRLEWLSVRIENQYNTVKVAQPNEQNKILSFDLKQSANSEALLKDYTATITEDSVKIFVPYLVHFNLKPEFTLSSGAKAYALGEQLVSGSSELNYLHPVHYKVVSSNGEVRDYVVSIYNSGISVLYVTTPNKQTVSSKETWIDGTEMTAYRNDGSVDYDATPDMVQIKGRGNSTWSATSEKRPYAIKLNKKDRVYGMLEHKRWVLMANYYDATFFRNAFSNYMAKYYTTADWTPSGEFVEYVLNGKHLGNYYFCEQAKICENRVPGEYLVEADLKDGTGQIKGAKSGNYFNVKHPEVENNSEELQYVKGILDEFETALYGGDWNKVKQLIDLESFADWYVIKELSKDYDGNMYTSCYCHIMQDGTIKMGPIWDFDLAWGGNPFETMMGSWGGSNYAWYNEPEDYYIGAKEQSSGTNWFLKFFEQAEFRALVLDRVNNMVDHMDDIMAYIDEYTQLLTLSASANTVGYSASSSGFGGFGGFNWGGSSSQTTTEKKSYAEEMAVIKTFVKERLLWIQNDLKNR